MPIFSSPNTNHSPNRKVKYFPTSLKLFHMDLVKPLPPFTICWFYWSLHWWGSMFLLAWCHSSEQDRPTQQLCTNCCPALVFPFGILTDMLTDKQPQLTSKLWTSISKLLGTQLRHTTEYIPPEALWSGRKVPSSHEFYCRYSSIYLMSPDWTQELHMYSQYCIVSGSNFKRIWVVPQ